MAQPLVTIGLPLVNEPLADVELAVRSIYAQDVVDWELIIFCDGSSDEHVARLRAISDSRVSIVRNPSPRGIGSNLNRLAHMATGKYIAILASDDLWAPDRLTVQLARLEGHNPPDVLAGQMIVISDSTTVEGAQKPAVVPESPRGWVASTPISHATAMARTEWFRDHPYDESLIRAQDRAFWITAHNGTSIEILDNEIYYYRVPKPISYRKYARSMRYTRRVIWTYGRKLCTIRELLSIFIESAIKQAITAVLTVAGGASMLYYRRIDPLTEDARRRHEKILRTISGTPVPGWDDAGVAR
jgi:glycosyltransferase involved in cell wall biosynthesis